MVVRILMEMAVAMVMLIVKGRSIKLHISTRAPKITTLEEPDVRLG